MDHGCVRESSSFPVLPAALLLLSSTPFAAQGGYRTRAFPRLGLEFPVASDYDAVPVQPLEKWTVLHYAEDLDKAREKDSRPQFSVFVIDKRAPVVLPPELKHFEPRVIDSVEAYLRAVHWDWRAHGFTDGKERDGYRARESSLGPGSREAPAGWFYAWESDDRIVGLIGFCMTSDEKYRKKHHDIWRYSAEKMRFSEPKEDALLAKLERYYERRNYLDPEYRIAVRSRLAPGWKAEDTDHYLVVYDTKDEPLIRLIKAELEAIRKEYLRLFPPATPIEAVSTVRVCKDREEYLQYGGPPGSGGYWHPTAEELVFYDYENVGRDRGTGKANSRIVLYHEAFHQYVHYSTGELPPHPWFNEGYGDYFSGARISSLRVEGIGVNPWRIETIQKAIKSGSYLSWRNILHLDKRGYYDHRVCYSQGWSMIYFLNESREAKKHPLWSAILPTYFETLKTAYAAELDVLPSTFGEEERQEAGARAREAAYSAAFSDVDLDEIEKAWKEFTMSLKP